MEMDVVLVDQMQAKRRGRRFVTGILIIVVCVVCAGLALIVSLLPLIGKRQGRPLDWVGEFKSTNHPPRTDRTDGTRKDRASSSATRLRRALEHLRLGNLDKPSVTATTTTKPLATVGDAADTLGLPCKGANDLVYWNPASKERMASPYATLPGTRYLSFEYDQGGWNNIRMGFESVVAIALGSNRTVVLPPAKHLYLLTKEAKSHGFLDFFDLSAIEAKFPGLFIEYSEFVAKEGKNLAGFRGDEPTSKNSALFLRNVGTIKEFDAGKNCLVFGDQPLDKRASDLCGPERKPLPFEPDNMLDLLIHIPMNQKSRLLSHFYAFVVFPDLPFDRYVKRFMRDHMHYLPELFCFAAPIIRALQEESTKHKGPNEGKFHSFHIRRNDFQFKEAWLSVPDILKLADEIPIEENSLVYVATDEKKKSIFKEMEKKYRVFYLDTFLKRGMLEGVNPNVFGMIEQIIISHGEKFLGTWWSTFTGYSNRMRGYRGVDKQSWYFPKNWFNDMQTFQSPSASGWWREWPVAWTNIEN